MAIETTPHARANLFTGFKKSGFIDSRRDTTFAASCQFDKTLLVSMQHQHWQQCALLPVLAAAVVLWLVLVADNSKGSRWRSSEQMGSECTLWSSVAPDQKVTTNFFGPNWSRPRPKKVTTCFCDLQTTFPFFHHHFGRDHNQKRGHFFIKQTFGFLLQWPSHFQAIANWAWPFWSHSDHCFLVIASKLT